MRCAHHTSQVRHWDVCETCPRHQHTADHGANSEGGNDAFEDAPDRRRVDAGRRSEVQSLDDHANGNPTPERPDPGGAGETYRTAAINDSGEAAWSTVVGDRRADGTLAQEMVFNRDGSTIHSEYAPHGDGGLGWDERHTVVTTGGDRMRFETSGDAQIIADADTGETLARSTWTPKGPESTPPVQPAFAPSAVPATIEAAAALYVWMSGSNGADSQAVLAFRAAEYQPGEEPSAMPEWVGTRTREVIDEACPRHPEVQSRTDEAADTVKREGNHWTAQQFGTAVHKNRESQINALDDPNFRAEVSISKVRNETYGTTGSIRIDVYERVDATTVCVYDIKTGRSGLSAARSIEIVDTVFKLYPDTKRILLIETRPRR